MPIMWLLSFKQVSKIFLHISSPLVILVGKLIRSFSLCCLRLKPLNILKPAQIKFTEERLTMAKLAFGAPGEGWVPNDSTEVTK